MSMWWIYALLSAIFAALVAVFAKIGIKGVDSDLATAVRTVIIILIAWGIVIAKGAASQLPGLTKQNWIFLILSGCATGLSWLFYFRALSLGEVSKVAPIDKLSVALAIIISIVFLHEKLTWQEGVGAILIIGGTFLLIFK
jgi:bacterial/archaeal transporter family protein